MNDDANPRDPARPCIAGVGVSGSRRRGCGCGVAGTGRVVEEVEFDTTDQTFAGLMRITTTLADADGATEMALDKLAGLVE